MLGSGLACSFGYSGKLAIFWLSELWLARINVTPLVRPSVLLSVHPHAHIYTSSRQ